MEENDWKVINEAFNHKTEARGRERRMVDKQGNVIVEWTEIE